MWSSNHQIEKTICIYNNKMERIVKMLRDEVWI